MGVIAAGAANGFARAVEAAVATGALAVVARPKGEAAYC